MRTPPFAQVLLSILLLASWGRAFGQELVHFDENIAFDALHPESGHWLGTIDFGDAEPHVPDPPTVAALFMSFEEEIGVTLIADIPAAGALGIQAEDVVLNGSNLTFTLPSPVGKLVFKVGYKRAGQRLAGTVVLTRNGERIAEGTAIFRRTPRPMSLLAPMAFTGSMQIPGFGPMGLTIVLASTPGDHWVGHVDIPLQGVEGLVLVNVSREDDQVTATLPGPAPAVFEMTMDAAATTLKGSMRQSGVVIVVDLERDADYAGAVPLPRPQHPEPPYPYEARELVASHPDGHRLAGTLTVPPGEGPHPCAVLISGSGQQDRDETILGHKPFLVLADRLTRRGIAVMRFDDRGVGGSTVDDLESLQAATSRDFATDVAAIVARLREDDAVDPQRIGLVGHSEGGLIGPMVAVEDDRIAFVVMLAGPGVPGRDILVLQMRLMFAAMGVEEAFLEEIERLQALTLDLILEDAPTEAIAEAVAAIVEAQTRALRDTLGDEVFPEELDSTPYAETLGVPWMRFFLAHDPRDTLAQVRCPVMACNGTLDLQVWHEQNLPAIERTMREAGGDVTIRRYEGLNHLFQPAETGGLDEYGKIETTFDEAAMVDIAKWILEQVAVVD